MISKVKTTKKIAFTAAMAATLIAGKFALSFIPNIEVVTTLVICFAFVFKFDAVFATLIFCTADIFIYPPSPDVIISYYVYWDLLALVVTVLSELGIKDFLPYFITSIIMTILFGVITSLTFTIFYGTNFFAVYTAGLYFYSLQLISTIVFMLTGFKLLTRLLEKIKNGMLNN